MNGMTTYFDQYPIPQIYNFPLMLTEWSPIVQNAYTAPVLPVTIISPQVLAPICPYMGVVVTESVVPVMPSVVDVSSVICNNVYSHVYDTELNCTDKSVSTEVLTNDVINIDENVPRHVEEKIDEIVDGELVNPIELYLKLPKELFPTAWMLSIDPNVIIEEFFKLASISENVSWILDLEFGVPRVPITRAIATYNVKFNSIHCKNTPGAIHPGFEKCNSDFKRVILFYYDCIISNWYNGYITLCDDKSVENFQSWLQIPMQLFGMCWP
ncbi:jg23355 [Pararge aegeria aegeria]|uniref:Jg23355 protein n=1 Tax=Pararge aegeria aegeria TaxID=348720 RepID=A0A8S4QI92_9NEOP|nr:jg23355 [Pararge aegeria aegeria]